jgi:hypothetical protein
VKTVNGLMIGVCALAIWLACCLFRFELGPLVEASPFHGGSHVISGMTKKEFMRQVRGGTDARPGSELKQEILKARFAAGWEELFLEKDNSCRGDYRPAALPNHYRLRASRVLSLDPAAFESPNDR